MNIKTCFLIIIFCIGLLPHTGHAQTGRITGQVTDEELHTPLQGVTIRLKTDINNTNPVITDAMGRYSIAAPPDTGTLVFSYVGYAISEVAVQHGRVLDVQMTKEDKMLDQVVVVGYGKQKKIDMTAAVSTLSGKEILQSPAINLTQNLAGRLTGVTASGNSGDPGQSATLTIRGRGTLNSSSPLYVVDGIERTDFSQLDPNEIESITVLKDAAAAVYGARAANGVFIVTTKKGIIGKPTISYTMDYGLQQPTLFIPVASAYQYATLRNQELINRGYDPTDEAQAGQFYTDQQITDYKNGKTGVNWYDLTFRKTASVTHQNISVTGGSADVRYFISAGYVAQDGMYDEDNYKRYNFRSNINASLSKSFTVSLNLDGQQSVYHAAGINSATIFAQAQAIRPTFDFARYPDGKPFNTNTENPMLETSESGYNKNTVSTFNGTLSAKWDMPFIAQGFSFTANASWGKVFLFEKNFSLPYTQYDEDAKGNVVAQKVINSPTGLTETYDQTYSSVVNAVLNYDHKFGKHSVSALLLYERSQSAGDSLSGHKQSFPSTSVDQLFASGSANQSLSGYGAINDARQSLVGRINYAYDSRYLLEAAFRSDGSYKFPPDRRFGFFPSLSVGWNVSDEKFFRNIAWLNFVDHLKLRLSKGLLGNDQVDAFQFQDAYTLYTQQGPVFNGTASQQMAYGVLPNPDITWEKTDFSNVGLEGELWHGLLGFEGDYFFKHTYDILWAPELSVPATFGRGLPTINYAAMDSHGFELRLTHENTIGKVKYNISGNISYAMNKVVKIDDAAGTPDYLKQLGKPLGFVVGYKSLGFFQSDEEAAGWYGGKEFGIATQAGEIKYADVTGDGIIDSKDQVVLSDNDNTPRMIMGLSLGANWNNFDVNLLLQGAAQLTYNLSATMFGFDGDRNFPAYLSDAWSPANTGAKYPLAWAGVNTVNNVLSDVWLKNDPYVRLKSFQIGYTFKQGWLEQKGIKGLRIYLSGFNLLTFSKVKDADPEYSATGYPQQKIFNAGINLNF